MGINKIIDGIDDFRKNAYNRLNNSTEWDEEHLDEIVELSNKLLRLKKELLTLKQTTKNLWEQ